MKGIVISNKMNKTIVVQVERLKKHPLYKKYYKMHKKYKVHDPENKFKKGNIVEFVACKPISKDKKWKVTEKSKIKDKKAKIQIND